MADNNKGNKFRQLVRANIGSIIMLALVVLLVFSPATKAWLMRQLLRTGFFNAHLTKETPVADFQDFSVGFKDGTTVNMASLRGKVVFINFWASWCPPCRAEFPGLAKLYSHFKNNKQIVFLFIDEDSVLSTGELFLRQEKYELPLAVKTGNVPSVIYDGTLPTTVILDKNGKLGFHHEGFAGYDSPEFIGQLEQFIKE